MTTTKLDLYIEQLQAARKNQEACCLIGDGQTRGTTLIYRSGWWLAVDHDAGNRTDEYNDLALVCLTDADPDRGLNQCAIAMDLDATGIWLVDADDLGGLWESYGDALEVHLIRRSV